VVGFFWVRMFFFSKLMGVDGWSSEGFPLRSGKVCLVLSSLSRRDRVVYCKIPTLWVRVPDAMLGSAGSEFASLGITVGSMYEATYRLSKIADCSRPLEMQLVCLQSLPDDVLVLRSKFVYTKPSVTPVGKEKRGRRRDLPSMKGATKGRL